MIQFKRKLYGLDKLFYDYIDTDVRSKNVFQIMDLPETFNLGKNQFKILANNDVLLKNSRIYIDIVDASGTAIYYEISSIANKDHSRSVIVYIYSDTPQGICSINIASRLFKNPIDGEEIFFNENIRDEPNVLWTGKVLVVPHDSTESKIKFNRPPVITYKERIEPLQVISGSSRYTIAPGTGSIVQSRSIVPRQITSDPLTVEQSDDLVQVNFKSNLISTGASTAMAIPKYSSPAIISSNQPFFSSSMVGGILTVNGINVEYPSDVVDSASFLGLSYSASVINVISSTAVEVFPPFMFNTSYRSATGGSTLFSANGFGNQSNYTMSFYDTYNLSSSLVTQSFLDVSAYYIEPIAGIVDSLAFSYKDVNSFGDFVDIGDFEVKKRNLLTDSASISFDSRYGISERSIGKFPNGLTDFSRYWISGSGGSAIFSIYDSQSETMRVIDGLLIKAGTAYPTTDFLYFKARDRYANYCVDSTEMYLSIDVVTLDDNLNDRPAQIDVYISGSNSVYADIVNESIELAPIKRSDFGTYIGSISYLNGSIRVVNIPFYVRSAGYIVPMFVIRSGQWHFGNIEMGARLEEGYSPNQARFFIPLDSVKKESDLIFNVKYKDRFGIKSDTETELSGLYFQGSSQIQFADLANIPSDLGSSITYSSASISTKQKTFMTQSFTRVNNTNGYVDVPFRIFVSDSDEIYTGSRYEVAMTYHIDTVIYGRTGSLQPPLDNYVWAGSLEGRAVVNASENSGMPLLYSVTALSGSTYQSMGVFGNGPADINLDSWFKFGTASLAGSGNENLNIRYHLFTTSSFLWDVDVASTCRVLKYERSWG